MVIALQWAVVYSQHVYATRHRMTLLLLCKLQDSETRRSMTCARLPSSCLRRRARLGSWMTDVTRHFAHTRSLSMDRTFLLVCAYVRMRGFVCACYILNVMFLAPRERRCWIDVERKGGVVFNSFNWKADFHVGTCTLVWTCIHMCVHPDPCTDIWFYFCYVFFQCFTTQQKRLGSSLNLCIYLCTHTDMTVCRKFLRSRRANAVLFHDLERKVRFCFYDLEKKIHFCFTI
jgi:hypothetical protein